MEQKTGGGATAAAAAADDQDFVPELLPLSGDEAAEGGEANAPLQATAAAAVSSQRDSWQPKEKEQGAPTRECMKRLMTDLRAVMRLPLPGIFVALDEQNATLVHGLVVGPDDTPYEGGFFYFILQAPDNYPHAPLKVRLMTTGAGTVRFGPNLYKNGKVCLSILGTWQGPGWLPSMTLSSVLLSIQSLLCDRPYHLEPGFEKPPSDMRDVTNYSDCIRHETLRVAVVDMAQDGPQHRLMPPPLRSVVQDLFITFKEHYEMVCTANLHRDGAAMVDPFGDKRGRFQYAATLERIRQLERTLATS
ncbi:ubiquitin-conjugating enzyme E2 Z [Tribonema minus]|uniref:Ubiquitin-conjugating enzyme E2 Z n=1 Tax=Tribonema minus TaxID=303371 RepID=A0A836C6T8_9STRA|nr:ubiquitin-conjugating enzyme E2 Z [Tribonema minus]